MSPQHAIEHLTWTLRGANGKESFVVATPAEKLEKYKRFFYHNTAIVHNFKSPVMDREKPPPLKHPDLASAVREFQQEWAAFEDFFKKNPEVMTNNAVFGPLNYEEWRRFHFKHMVHHLSQFGVTTSEAHGLVDG